MPRDDEKPANPAVGSFLDARGVLDIELRRSEVRNAFDDAVLLALRHELAVTARQNAVRLVVLRGRGPVFCAGGDVHWMASLGTAEVRLRVEAARRIADVLLAIRQCPAPVVCIVQGAAIGGGVGLAAASDVVLATENAQFGLSEARLGLVPACVAPFILARVGAAHARRLFVTGERIAAVEAHRVGLVDYLVPDSGDLNAAVEDRIARMLLCGPQALARAKRLVADLSAEGSLFSEAVLTAACQAMADVWGSAEGREGMAAYRENRAPSWLTPDAGS